MAGFTRYATDWVRNKAHEDRSAHPKDVERVTDPPDVRDGETWEEPTGHSSTRHAWTVSLAMVAAFLLGGAGFTFGPRVLLWVGVGLFVALGVYSLAAHAWTDYDHGNRVEHDRDR